MPEFVLRLLCDKVRAAFGTAELFCAIRFIVAAKMLDVVGAEATAKPLTGKRRVRFFSLCSARFILALCPSGEIGRHSGLKIRRFVNSGRTGSIPVSGTNS
ncbi:MAG: hypothetical protein JWM42_1709 [Burkholderia sp.]|nr:hypothetical protein [Burkholderia sp.]